MSFLLWAGIGFGISMLTAVPLFGWVKKMGAYSYATARARAMTGKLLDIEEMERVEKKDMSTWLEKSEYWPILQSSESREKYEIALEKLEKEKRRKIISFSPGETKKFLRTIKDLKKKVDKLKMVVNAIEGGEKEMLPALLGSEEFDVERLMEAEGTEEAVSILQEMREGQFVSLNGFYSYGLTGVECALDRFFFYELKRSVSNKECEMVRKIIKKIYIYRTVTRLKMKGYGPREISEMMGIGMRGVVLMELETLLRETAEEFPLMRESILEDSPAKIERSFDRLLFEEMEKVKHSNQLGFGPIAEVAFKSSAEIEAARNAWWLR